MTEKFDIAAITEEYNTEDFGFSAISEEEYNRAKTDSEKIISDYRERMVELENTILPLITKLLVSSDKEYIYWPKRKPILEATIQSILKLTRS